MMRMVFVVLVSLTMEFFVMGTYWVLSWILGLGFMDFIVYSVISGFFFGLSFYDYSLERYKQGVFSTFGYAFSKFGMVTLTGLVFMLIFAIPYIGIPIAPVIATMIATVIYIKQLK
jgi:CysZ protein